MDYENPLGAEPEELVEAMCCICGVIVPIEYATSIVLTPPGEDEGDQHLYCHGHHLRSIIVDSVPLHPAITGDEAQSDEDEESADDPVITQALETHFERNDSLLEQLSGLGANLTAPTQIAVQFVAPSHARAAHLAAALYAEGYLVLALAPEEGGESGPWQVEASIERAPAAAASDEVTRRLVRLAVSFESEYGGWGLRR